MLKKFTKIIITISILVGFTFCYFGHGDYNELKKFPYSNNTIHNNSCDSTNLGDCINIQDNNSIINKLLTVFGLDSSTFGGNHKFLNYVKVILNLALSLLSLIALIVTIYTFYMMFFTDNEAGIKKAKGNLVGIFIALAIIGLARIIVSFIFWWYQSNWQNAL